MSIQSRVDAVVEGFDIVRKRFKPTNGECLAIFTVLAADILRESGTDYAREALYNAMQPVLKSGGEDIEALRKLFERCAIPPPNRKLRAAVTRRQEPQ